MINSQVAEKMVGRLTPLVLHNNLLERAIKLAKKNSFNIHTQKCKKLTFKSKMS